MLMIIACAVCACVLAAGCMGDWRTCWGVFKGESAAALVRLCVTGSW